MIIRKALAGSTIKFWGTAHLSKLTPKFYYSQKDERFFRFIDFDAKYLEEIPLVFQPLKPFIMFVKDGIMQINEWMGLPWWVLIVLTSVFVRFSIFPLVILQMKKMSRMGPVWPVFAHLKQTWRDSNLPKLEKARLCYQVYKKLAIQEGFKMRSVFVYNLAYYPILISMVFALRNILSTSTVGSSSFLYLPSLSDIDPYFILPTLTIAAYYWNFQRFITPENKHTLISKMRSIAQVILIIWYPFLCCWPSGIVLYMFTNAILSVLQSSLMQTMWFQSKINPKVMHYNLMLATAEYDKGTSESIVQAIKTGEESLMEKSIKQQVIVLQTQQMIKKLNEELIMKDENDEKQK